jgi:hypothetical protein
MNRALHLSFLLPLPLEEIGRSTSFQTFSVPVTGNAIRLDTTPPPGFQPRLINHKESTSGFSPAGDTGSGTMVPFPVHLLREVPDMKEWLLPAALWVYFRFPFTLF